jgi:hypothetical protein
MSLHYGGVSRESIDNPEPWFYRFSMTEHLIKQKNSKVPLRGPFLLALSLLLGGCQDATAPVITTWEGTLTPEPPQVLSGRVAAVSQFGRTIISIQVEDAEPDLVYGWRINAGSCQSEGSLQGGSASYPPLSPGESGTASGETTLPGLFRSGESYAAWVYLSEGASQEIVACGELEQTQ